MLGNCSATELYISQALNDVLSLKIPVLSKVEAFLKVII